MKKLLLLLAAGTVAANVSAQYARQSVISTTPVGIVSDVKIKNNTDISKSVQIGANKTTGTPADSTRWYSHREAIQAVAAQGLSRFIFPIWYDSTVMVAYSNGLSNVNFAAAAQVISPRWFVYNTSSALYPQTLMGVTSTDAYRVDSVYFSGAYVKRPSRPTSIVDTMILSVAPHTQYYYWLTANTAWAAAVTTADTLKAPAPDDSFASRRIIYHPNAVSWKVPLFDADRDPDSAGFVTVKSWQFAVPNGGINVPAGQDFAISVAFKSGDIVQNPNQDSINMYHRFYLASYGSTTSKMPYTWYSLTDRNGSSTMFAPSTNPWFTPNVAIEATQTNTSAFAYEFHDIAGRVRCQACLDLVGIDSILTVKGINSNIVTTNAYPNPANSSVVITYGLNEASDVNITITNTVGQVLKTQRVGKTTVGKATFDVADLSAGVYFYTIEANGQRLTNRLLVSK